MNNKQLGTEFEREIVEYMKKRGYWVHFLAPDNRGAQPFDIIAVKDGWAVAIECKTLDDKTDVFSIDRLEDNQKFAFEYWLKCGNVDPLIAVGWKNGFKFIQWTELRQKRKVKLSE